MVCLVPMPSPPGYLMVEAAQAGKCVGWEHTLEVHVSLTTRKNQAKAQASAGLDLARRTATQVTPLAKNASTTAAQSMQDARNWAAPRIGQGVQTAREQALPRIGEGVQSARVWAAPRIEQGVHRARSWAAPRIEQLGRALSETVAPKVSDALTQTAHRIDPSDQARKRRLWPRVLTGLAIVAAAGGAIGAMLRRRSAKLTEEVIAEDEAVLQAVPEAEEKQDTESPLADAEAGSNGRVR
jgi:hypothetical protein